MKDNTIRLHLGQPEIEKFMSEGKVVGTSQLGPSLVQSLRYSLLKDDEGDTVTATFIANNIKVFVPTELAEKWAQADQKTLEEQMPLDEGEFLHILIEKDSE